MIRSAYKGFFPLNPLVPIAVAFIIGIMIGRPMTDVVSWWSWLVAVLILLASFIVLRRSPFAQTCLILVCFVLLGASRVSQSELSSRVSLPEGDFTYEGVIASDPVERGRTIRFDLLVASGRLRGRQLRVTLMKDTVLRRYATLGVGNGFVACSRLEAPRNFGSGNFDYVTYLKGRNVAALTFVRWNMWMTDDVSLLELSRLQRATIAALWFRRKLIDDFARLGFEGQASAVVAAMTLGDKSALSAATRDVYSITGASHILALSGMHLGMVYALLSLLWRGRRWRLLKETVLIAAIWAYVLLVGLSPSVVRAALMITLYGIGRMARRQGASLNTLAFAALTMLLVNPLSLYDIGFELSFLAVAFIVVFQPLLGPMVSTRWQMRHRLGAWTWQLLVMTIVAQAGTMPLVAYYFERLPLCFVLTNYVVVPAAMIILYGTAAMMALGFVPLLQWIAAQTVICAVTVLNKTLAIMASWPWSSVGGIRINEVQVVALYVATISTLCLLAIGAKHIKRANERRDEYAEIRERMWGKGESLLDV